VAALTDTQCRKAKAAKKNYKLPDGRGLQLFISPTGLKSWQYRYKLKGGSEKVLTIGNYPEVSLADARTHRDKARAELNAGKDPAIVKRLSKLTAQRNGEHTFEVVAREWWEFQKPNWVAQHAKDVLDSLVEEVFPHIGSAPIKDLSPVEVLAVLRMIEQRGAIETARRVRQRMSAVFVYAIASGRGDTDPAAVVQKAMSPLMKGRQPAITNLLQARTMLRRVETNPSHPVTQLAMRILALTAVRPGSLLTTPWSEWTDEVLEEGLWLIPAERMKLKMAQKVNDEKSHIVPLSSQCVEAIRAVRRITGRGPYAFPNGRSAHKTMSGNALGYLLNRSGYHHKHVPHGWRATFSSVMNENFPGDKHIIDLMLAHVPKDKVEGAYNRALHLKRRIQLAQEWADLIMKDAPAADSLLPRARKILKDAEN
jgi:integrase